jgi:hypothetical protein
VTADYFMRAMRSFFAANVGALGLMGRAVDAEISNPATRGKIWHELLELQKVAESSQLALSNGQDDALACMYITTLQERVQSLAAEIDQIIRAQTAGGKGGKPRIFTPEEAGRVLRIDRQLAARGDVHAKGRAGRVIEEANAVGEPLTVGGKRATARQIRDELSRIRSRRKT